MTSTTSTTISLEALDAEQVASLIAQIKEREAAHVEAAKRERANARALVATFVDEVVNTLTESTFRASGARGYSLGGSKFATGGKTYRVSVLIRDEATIPPKEK